MGILFRINLHLFPSGKLLQFLLCREGLKGAVALSDKYSQNCSHNRIGENDC